MFFVNGAPVEARAPFWRFGVLRIGYFWSPGNGCETGLLENGYDTWEGWGAGFETDGPGESWATRLP